MLRTVFSCNFCNRPANILLSKRDVILSSKHDDDIQIVFLTYFRDVVLVIETIARVLNVPLSVESLGICIAMIESGVNPEALAIVCSEIRAAAAATTATGSTVLPSPGSE